ncbi:MAG: hypothetical protein K8I30_23075, partial [Anaerolineae bacterium]|nr:hypothetical protein [Anaerolineae bacterium]
GDGHSLGMFLTWGVRNFPADHYALAFASHGAGWEGIVSDDTEGATTIPLPALRAALAAATREAGVERFDLLINDACLMGSVEYDAALSDYFRYSLASPEIVVNPAHNMTLFIQALRENPALDMPTLAAQLIDQYMNVDMAALARSDVEYLSSSLVDLQQFDAVRLAVERLARVLSEDMAASSDLITRARGEVYTYAHVINQHALIDLGDFAARVKAGAGSGVIASAADDLVNALNAARVIGVGGARVRDRVSYYNIYFPAEAGDMRTDYFVNSPLTAWGRMLRSYFSVLTPQTWVEPDAGLLFHPAMEPTVRTLGIYPPTASYYRAALVGTLAQGRDIARYEGIVDRLEEDGAIVRLNTFVFVTDYNSVGFEQNYQPYLFAGLDYSPLSFDATLPVVSDGVNAHFENIRQERDYATLEGRYRPSADSPWQDVTVVFDLGTVMRVVSRTEGS